MAEGNLTKKLMKLLFKKSWWKPKHSHWKLESHSKTFAALIDKMKQLMMVYNSRRLIRDTSTTTEPGLPSSGRTENCVFKQELKGHCNILRLFSWASDKSPHRKQEVGQTWTMWNFGLWKNSHRRHFTALSTMTVNTLSNWLLKDLISFYRQTLHFLLCFIYLTL